MSANRIAATGLQLLSYVATANFFAFFLKPGDPRAWLVAAGVAALLEGFFIAMKESAFKPGLPPKIVAALFGYGPDGLINTGGIMFFATALLTFRPVAAMLGVAEIDLANPDETMVVALGVSVFFGFGLSIAPHVLWRTWGRQAKKAAKA